MPFSVQVSWDTNVNHYFRDGLFDNLPNNIKTRSLGYAINFSSTDSAELHSVPAPIGN